MSSDNSTDLIPSVHSAKTSCICFVVQQLVDYLSGSPEFRGNRRRLHFHLVVVRVCYIKPRFRDCPNFRSKREWVRGRELHEPSSQIG